jgi:hypothetical protein
MSWRQTATVYTRKDDTIVFDQLDRLEGGLQPDDWVQVAGRAMRFEHGFQKSGNSPVVYMVTTRAIYASRESMFGKWKDMPPIAVTAIRRYGLTEVGIWTAYFGDTAQGELSIAVENREEAAAIAQAVKDAYMHQTEGFPLFAPDSPEAAGADPERTAAHAAAATASGLGTLVDTFRDRYQVGDSEGIWAERCTYGYDVGEDRFEKPGDWFWFNAYPALSGLNLGKDRGAPLSTFCGYAEQAQNRSDPEQVRAVQEIKQRYFAGGSR